MKLLTPALLSIGLLVLSGCVSPRSAFVPPGGALFASYKAPLVVNYDQTAVDQNSDGEASAEYVHDILITGLDFAWSDCSLNAAVKDGRFSKVGAADYEFFNVLGVYARTTVHVYEDPVVQK